MFDSKAHNPGVLVSSHTGSSGFFVGMSLGKTLQGPSLVLVKLKKADMNNVTCHHDYDWNTIENGIEHHSISQLISIQLMA